MEIHALEIGEGKPLLASHYNTSPYATISNEKRITFTFNFVE